ncbi:MAG: peptidoglycan bridge formation glycyltransferase FemA/FemB family protein [Candidatus Doudnabacteria bacterium]
MKFIELEEKDKFKYQSLVELDGNFLQNWSWGDFQKSIGTKVLRFAVEEDGVFVFTAQALYISQINKAYLFLPYGPVVLKTEHLEKYFNFFAHEIKKKYPELLFIRFEYWGSVTFSKDFKIKKSQDLNPHNTLVLDLTKSEEDLLREMHPKTRYNIKISKKHEVEVRIQNELGSAGDLFLETAERQGIKAFEKDYYQKMLEFFETEQRGVTTKLYTAWHEGEVLAANLMLYSRSGKFKNLMVYLFGGSSDKRRNVMAPYALHWQAIGDAKKAGYENYDFWGYESDPKHPWHGFSKFKAGFSGKEISGPGTYDYVYSSAWYNVYKILRTINRKIR